MKRSALRKTYCGKTLRAFYIPCRGFSSVANVVFTASVPSLFLRSSIARLRQLRAKVKDLLHEGKAKTAS